jgi:peptidoglycan/xylan/chitin deacetylase (PgdA/CDA1 family)
LDAVARRAPRHPQRATDWLHADTSKFPLFLTFDDGGVGAYTVIAPALERRGWRGHFFVTAGQVGAPTFLSASQIRELSRRGHVIGSHSYTHPVRMAACSRAELADEWQRSVAALSDVLGQTVVTGSVPGGFYGQVVAEEAAAAGIKTLFTSNPTTRCIRVADCLVLGRYTLRRWSKPEVSGALAAGHWAPRARQWAVYGSLAVARRVFGDRYTQVRQAFWRRLG